MRAGAARRFPISVGRGCSGYAKGSPTKKKSLTGKSGKAQPVPPTGIEPVRCFHRGILSPLRLPVPPPRQVYMNVIDCNMEAAPRIELGIKVLQTSALPLGYAAIWSGKRGSNPRPQPWQGCALPLSYFRAGDPDQI